MKLSEWCAQQRGRPPKLAAYLRVKPVSVFRWLNGERDIPLRHAPYIQVFTSNDVTCEELLPDMADYFQLIRNLKPRAQALYGKVGDET